MSSARAERLVNLVLCLLSTRQYLTAERIRAIVPGYASAASDEAFFRMFERDKAELRDLGVPLETGRMSMFDTADGYRIARQDYELGEVQLAADEAAAVALAARLWDSPELAGAARGALVKLRAAGVDVDDAASMEVEPKVRAAEPAFGPLLAAVQAGQTVRFEHRPNPNVEFRTRTVEPWGVVSWRGRWYLVGHDRDRQAVRCFRVSRIADPVVTVGQRGAVRPPPDTDLVELVRRSAGPPPVSGLARVWVADGQAIGLRRAATVVDRREHDGQLGDVLELELRSLDTVARWIAGHGPDVAVLEPPELAREVRQRWLAAARTHAARPAKAEPAIDHAQRPARAEPAEDEPVGAEPAEAGRTSRWR